MKIFIVHKGRHIYVKSVLKELLKNNKGSNIVLLTDNKELSKAFFGFNIIYENISDYSFSSQQLEKLYEHMSKNPFNYELFCIQRWFIILEYMEKNNLDNCWHIDSDVLIPCDLEEYKNKNLEDFDFCYVGSCGHIFYGNKKGLNKFKDFVLDEYKNKIGVLKGYYKGKRFPTYKRNNGVIACDKSCCVSDMTLFYLFVKENFKGIKCKDIGIVNNGSVFDNTINRPEGFTYGKYFKSIEIINGEFYGKIDKKNEKVKFNGLHFQGDAKNLIQFYEERNLGIKYHIMLFYTKVVIKLIVKISNKLGIKNILMKIYHIFKSIIYKQSLPLR